MQKVSTPTQGKWRGAAFAGIALGIIAIDQITKALVRASLAVGETGWDIGFFSIYHVQNTGAAFGIFKGFPYVFMALQILAVLAILFLVVFMSRRWRFINLWIVRTGLALVMAGAAGNVIDRIAFEGRVTDFLNVEFYPGIFNVADASAVVGSIILAYAIIFKLAPGKTEHE